jgi:hypothetical protein
MLLVCALVKLLPLGNLQRPIWNWYVNVLNKWHCPTGRYDVFLNANQEAALRDAHGITHAFGKGPRSVGTTYE